MKAIRHAHHEQYLRLANVDAALLVSSGRWTYTSKFEARKAAERARPARPLWLRIGMFMTTLAMIVAALLLSTSAKAADKPVPKLVPQVCLTQSQAAQVFKGKKLKYRMVKDEQGRHEVCWYAGKTLPKHAFVTNLRSTSVASKPFRAIQQDTQRARDLAGAVPAAGTPINTTFTATLEHDAVRALTGRAERDYERASFEAMWTRALKAAGGR